jgi:hypothetical protein
MLLGSIARRRRSTAVGSGGRTLGVFARRMERLASEVTERKTVMIHVEAGLGHRFERPAEGP